MFYNNALIQCDNSKCNQKLTFYKWYKHFEFNCDQRIRKCPAIQCSATGTPNKIISQSNKCPFHTTWCAGCKIKWTVLDNGHNCEKVRNIKNSSIMCMNHPVKGATWRWYCWSRNSTSDSENNRPRCFGTSWFIHLRMTIQWKMEQFLWYLNLLYLIHQDSLILLYV